MLKRVLSAHILWMFTFCSLSVQANVLSFAFSTPASPNSMIDKVGSAKTRLDDLEVEDMPITQLGSEYHNSIELLQNRFRIDFAVEEITMIFFREFGSLPIVLVRPDGSKIFQADANGEDIFWFDTSTYDMISLKNPTPGPWQAIGKIQPQSRVMVISDIALHVEPLPEVVFSGEILKQTAYLTNNGTPIDYTAFRDVVQLTINLASTNNPDSNNFGANTETIASFEDNGKGMDERPLDGVFTGQFNLAIADGEWIPTYTVSTPMYSREQVDPNIMLYPNPIVVDIEMDGGGSGYHKLTVDAERKHVDISTLLIDGKVRFPNGDIQNFSLTKMSGEMREYMIVNADYGVYRVKLTAYGSTLNSREFILDVPEYSFLSEEPELVASISEVATVQADIEDGATESNFTEQKMTTSTLISLIVGINLLILIFGAGLIWWFTLDKKLKVDFSKGLEGSTSKQNVVKKPGLLAKLFKPKVTKELDLESPDPEIKASGGFMDLSIPKE